MLVSENNGTTQKNVFHQPVLQFIFNCKEWKGVLSFSDMVWNLNFNQRCSVTNNDNKLCHHLTQVTITYITNQMIWIPHRKANKTPWKWKSKTRVTSYKFKSTGFEFKSTNYEFKPMSYKFQLTSYKTETTSCKIKSTSWEIKSMSCEIKSMI